MKLEKLYIKNFRSIGENGLEMEFITNHNIFVGENNVGKSSILEAIKKILDPGGGWDAEDWHLGNQDATLEINITVTLDDAQIKQIISLFGFPLSINEFRQNFTNKLTCKIEKNSNESFLTFVFEDFNIERNTGWFGETDRLRGYLNIGWNDILNKIGTQKLTLQKIKEIFEEIRKERGREDNARIILMNDISQVCGILSRNFVFIEEFRERPQKVLGEFLTSATGKDLASVLFNLKNSRQKKKFEQIQTYFNKLFPNLTLEVIRENNEIKILIQKHGVESTTFFIGSGILESILLLTHLIAHKDKILCLDHPELHLHPHTQRLLASFLKNAKDSQIFMVTHSPYFVNFATNTALIRVFQKDIQTGATKLPSTYFNEEEYFKLAQFLDVDSKELFFARKVVIVEGQTELGALPIFSSHKYSFDENGVSVINVGGKNSFGLFAKLCEGCKIPYLILADIDANEILTGIKAMYPNCKFYILPSNFEGLLPNELVEEAKLTVGEKSKPRIGKYVATKLIESRQVPEPISRVIEEVRNL